MKSLTIIAALVAVAAQAQIKPYVGSTKADNADYKEFYMSDAKIVSESDAFNGAIRGQEVYRCVKQELAMGKSGRSASMKNVPKKK